jgi:hypothetical protein
VLTHSIGEGDISSTSVIKIILAWTPSGTFLQCHMAKVRVMVLGEESKRLARKASQQNSYEEQIMIPRQLYEWVVLKIPSVPFGYCTLENRNK